MVELRAQMGEVYETNPECDVQEVVLIVGPCPPGRLQHDDHIDRYHLCARLFLDERYSWTPTVLMNDGELEHWYRRVS